MSEVYTSVKPWEWLTAPEFWTDKISMYLKAKGEIEKFKEDRAKRNQQTQSTAG